jgi:hypothetical protein
MTDTATHPVVVPASVPLLPASCHETHIGVVFLVGDRAYKLKKPVRTEFLDFTTAAARLEACRREVALNRRMAPDVYLGVSDVTDPALGRRGRPGPRRASGARASTGRPARPRRAGPDIDAAARPAALRGRWMANLDRTSRFIGRLVDGSDLADAARLALRFLAGRGPLLGARVAQRRIVDGHGDLVADDVFCLPDGPRHPLG